MTFLEMNIAVLVLGGSLFLLAGWMRREREAAKHDLAVRMLVDLDKALVRYQRAEGQYPQTFGPDSAISVTVILADHERCRPILDSLPNCLWERRQRRVLVDPWGMPLRYHSEKSKHPEVAANGGRPVFESAGPDRDFGDLDPSAVGDNLRSDDPGPQGFRLHDALREPLNPTEQEERGQEEH
jgi:hypothetical protein